MIDRQAESEKPSAFAMPQEEQPPAEPPAPALAISDEEIERILRNGSGHHDSKLRIAALYAGDSTPADRTEYLKTSMGQTADAAGSFLTGPTAISSTAPRGW